jgi:hypothetical protein
VPVRGLLKMNVTLGNLIRLGLVRETENDAGFGFTYAITPRRVSVSLGFAKHPEALTNPCPSTSAAPSSECLPARCFRDKLPAPLMLH